MWTRNTIHSGTLTWMWGKHGHGVDRLMVWRLLLGQTHTTRWTKRNILHHYVGARSLTLSRCRSESVGCGQNLVAEKKRSGLELISKVQTLPLSHLLPGLHKNLWVNTWSLPQILGTHPVSMTMPAVWPTSVWPGNPQQFCYGSFLYYQGRQLPIAFYAMTLTLWPLPSYPVQCDMSVPIIFLFLYIPLSSPTKTPRKICDLTGKFFSMSYGITTSPWHWPCYPVASNMSVPIIFSFFLSLSSPTQTSTKIYHLTGKFLSVSYGTTPPPWHLPDCPLQGDMAVHTILFLTFSPLNKKTLRVSMLSPPHIPWIHPDNVFIM